MKADHPLAANIFERLSRFTPRQGEKRKREPVEDFITEAIAFLLLSSEKFQSEFITRILSITREGRSVTVATQDVDEGFDGRADLVLEFQTEPLLRVGIEVKRFADFQDDQLKRLKAGFPFAAYILAPESYIRKEKELIDAECVTPVFLEDVHQLCFDHGQQECEPLRTLFRQFSEFLQSKGHARVKFTQHPMNIRSVSEAARMMDEWSAFLSKLRSQLELERSGQWAIPRWEGPTAKWPNHSFYGVYGPNSYYAGFRIGMGNTVDCYYEENRSVHDDKRQLGPQMDRAEGRVYCHRTRSFPNTPVQEIPAKLLTIFRELQTDVRRALDEWEQ